MHITLGNRISQCYLSFHGSDQFGRIANTNMGPKIRNSPLFGRIFTRSTFRRHSFGRRDGYFTVTSRGNIESALFSRMEGFAASRASINSFDANDTTAMLTYCDHTGLVREGYSPFFENQRVLVQNLCLRKKVEPHVERH